MYSRLCSPTAFAIMYHYPINNKIISRQTSSNPVRQSHIQNNVVDWASACLFACNAAAQRINPLIGPFYCSSLASNFCNPALYAALTRSITPCEWGCLGLPLSMCAFSIAAIISSDIILLFALISPSTSPVATDAAAVGGSGREGSGATADASERISGGVVSIVLDVNLCALKHHLIFGI